MKKTYNIAIVGASGVVGEALLDLLAERQFPINHLYLLASENSVGKTVMFRSRPYSISNLDEFDFSNVDYAFFSAGANISQQYVPIATQAGCMVIDNTSYFRYDQNIPLVIPEVNPEMLIEAEQCSIVANPNCSTIQMLVAIKPIYDLVGIQRINIATYQAVSGKGKQGITELAEQTTALLNAKEIQPHIFPQKIAFNVIAHIDAIQKNGYSQEEMKMVLETQKILNDDQIKINPTAVRVPVFYGHSQAIHLETEKPIEASEIKQLLNKVPGICVLEHPTPLLDATSQDHVFVGRIRQDISHPRGINLWVVADNVRKGAALNAIQIAELLLLKDQHTKDPALTH